MWGEAEISAHSPRPAAASMGAWYLDREEALGRYKLKRSVGETAGQRPIREAGDPIHISPPSSTIGYLDRYRHKTTRTGEAMGGIHFLRSNAVAPYVFSPANYFLTWIYRRRAYIR